MRFLAAILSATSVAIGQDRVADLPFVLGPDRVVTDTTEDLYTKDSSIVIRCDTSGIVAAYLTKSWDRLLTCSERPHAITCYALNFDNTVLAAGTQEGEVLLWNLQTGQTKQVVECQDAPIRRVYYLPSVLCVGLSQSAILGLPEDPVTGMVDPTGKHCPPHDTFIPFNEPPQPPRDHQPQPIYPVVALASGATGKVVVQVCVGADGVVLDWRIVKEEPEGMGFASAVAQVIPQWQFTPARSGGQPTAVWIAIPFSFPRG